MMRKRLSALLASATLLLSATVTTVAAAPTEAEIEQAKREAALAVGQGSQKNVQMGEDGQPVLDSNGQPVYRDTSAQSVRDNLKMFQENAGLQSVDPESSPNDKSRGGRATMNVKQGFDFTCSKQDISKLTFQAGGLAFHVISCQMLQTQVQAVTFTICDNSMKAGVCATNADFAHRLQIASNTFGSFKGMKLGLGCNSAARCRLTVEGSYSAGGTDESIKQEGAQMAQQSTLVKQMEEVVTDPNYSSTSTETGETWADCTARNSELREEGKYQTCDGKQTNTLATPQNSGQCEAAPQCLQESTLVNRFERTCTRTFPLTERAYTQHYTQTATCDIVTPLAGAGPEQKATNSCDREEGPRANTGMTLIGASKPVCVAYLPGSDSVCVAEQRSEYWAITVPQSTDIVESPSPVNTALPVNQQCDTSETSSTLITECQGEWFGRTLESDQCVGYFKDGEGETVGYHMTYATKAGCGLCTQYRRRETCYAVPAAWTEGTGERPDVLDVTDTCKKMDLSGCSFSRAAPETLTGGGNGLVASQTETYTCTREVKQCVKWSPSGNDPACLKTDMAYGTDKVGQKAPESDGSLNNAMVSAAIIDGTAKGIEDCNLEEDKKNTWFANEDGDGGNTAKCKDMEDQKVPLLFGGENLKCHRPVGGIGSMLQKNCCRTNLERPKKGNIIQGGCSMDEARLAAARRSKYSHYVGDYCSRRSMWPFRKCLERTESYCVFRGVLARLIQEQGREQLAEMTASSANDKVAHANLNFRYHDGAGGSWTAPVTVNGVKVAAWQWPSYCADKGEAAAKLMESAEARDCPTVVSTWFAACDTEAGCGALPDEPDVGSLDWTLKAVDPLENLTTAISKYSVVTGACSPDSGACSYKVSAWPVGTGGRAVVTKDLSWSLFSGASQGAGATGQAASAYQMNNIGDYMFRMSPVNGAIGGPMPATVPLGFSRDGGQTWTTVNLPTSDYKDKAGPLPGSDATITGHCDSASNLCSYRVTGTATVRAKSWGSPQNPDCSGFTAGQLAMLDFSKMDLSEWLDTVLDKTGNGASPSEMSAAANKQFQEFNAQFQRGEVKGNAPVDANYARVVPSEGFGAFDVRIAASGYWPEFSDDPARNTEKVNRVRINWGDCSLEEDLTAVDRSEGQGFRGFHKYEVPNSDKHACLKAGAGDNLERNIVHVIKLTIYTNKATYTRTLSVENAWSVFPGSNDNNVNVNQTTTVTAPKTGD